MKSFHLTWCTSVKSLWEAKMPDMSGLENILDFTGYTTGGGYITITRDCCRGTSGTGILEIRKSLWSPVSYRQVRKLIVKTAH